MEASIARDKRVLLSERMILVQKNGERVIIYIQQMNNVVIFVCRRGEDNCQQELSALNSLLLQGYIFGQMPDTTSGALSRVHIYH